MKKSLLLLLFWLYSCNDNYERLEKQQTDFQSQPIYKTILTNFLDTLSSWKRMNIRMIQEYKDTQSWKIDMILMNKKNTYGLIIVIKKSHTFDAVDFFGIKKDSIWKFYSLGFPNFIYEKDNYNRKFSDISFLIRKHLMRMKPDLIVDCNLNDEFIEAFFEDESLDESHRIFLNDTENK